MSQTKGYNPSLVKTAIDEVMESTYDHEREPREVLANNSVFFKQSTIDNNAWIIEEEQPVGYFQSHTEDQVIRKDTIRTGNQKTFTVNDYYNSVMISEVFYKDDQHDSADRRVRQFARKARLSRDKWAYEDSYGNAFTETTPDGIALISNSHVSMSGDTIDNLETGTFSQGNLKTLVKRLRLQKDQNGDLGGHYVAGLLVSIDDFPEAMEVTKSELKPASTDNDLNWVSFVYPNMVVGTSDFLSSDHNSLNTNVNTSYFVVSDDHMIIRKVRQGLQTWLIEPQYDEQHRWEYRAQFREMVCTAGWEGIAGSNGTV